VTGRVLDMETHQPLENVQIRRVDADGSTAKTEPPKGARALEDAGGIRSGRDGTFDLASERTLGLFRDFGWYSVTLAFERDGYQTTVRSYTLANSTNAPSGEPLVRAGDVLLPRRSQ
jgi:hypothetical protein